MRHQAEIEILEKTNKNGEPYEILAIHMVLPNGTTVQIHEVYMRDALKDIINLVADLKSGDIKDNETR